ncbi:SSI family serine proteinase inhibitor [Streptomyces sp. NPDC089919]|uniref:SSI family serine proteinase inhibitor n=1 Tax=Streptomyces sp. NPDC089919 TaxID=3155188 RepID=UPI003449152B
MLRHLALAAVASAVAAGPLPPLPSLGLLDPPAPPPDRLTVTVSESGSAYDGTYKLECDPPGGNHPQAKRACDRLDQLGREGQDPFAPVGTRQLCSTLYGGPATARVTGTWHGHRVDTTFKRTDGCEISRWHELEPLLPTPRS